MGVEVKLLTATGIPRELVLELAKLAGSKIFVETGTFHGDTTRWASNHFESVHTVERAEQLYDLYSEELSRITGVNTYLGDSRNVLTTILGKIGDQKTVFWLDGHWSGGNTAGEHDECPLIGELACLTERPDDIILIDDARLFLCAPPLPHDPLQWPTIADIIGTFLASKHERFFQIVDDVVIAVPNRASLKNHLIGHAQGRADKQWSEFLKRSRRNSLLRRILNKVQDKFS